MSRIGVGGLAVCVVWCAASHLVADPPAAPAANAAVEEAVRQVTQHLVRAFNAGKAAEIGGLFVEGGELIDDAGHAHRGPAEIEAAFARFFQKYAGATSTMTADSVWMINPKLAIEEGRRLVFTQGGKTAAGSRYTLVMTNDSGAWKIASGREVEDDDVLSPHDRLLPLAWMVGEWVDENPAAVVQISCKWSDDKNYLLVEFQAQVQGKPTLRSSQRIGWDPLTEKIKSWVFDSDGGHGEGLWCQVENHWLIKSTAVLPDGQTGSATIMLEPRDKDSYWMKGFDRIRGKAAEPDFELTVVRRPPAPAK